MMACHICNIKNGHCVVIGTVVRENKINLFMYIVCYKKNTYYIFKLNITCDHVNEYLRLSLFVITCMITNDFNMSMYVTKFGSMMKTYVHLKMYHICTSFF